MRSQNQALKRVQPPSGLHKSAQVEMRVTQAPLFDFYISEKIERRVPLRRRVRISGKLRSYNRSVY